MMENTRGGGGFETADRFDSDVSLPKFSSGTLEQLPRYTSRASLYRVYSFLLSVAISGSVAQTISLLPATRVHAERVPYAALGLGLVATGAFKVIRGKKQNPGLAEAFLGTLLGAVIGV